MRILVYNQWGRSIEIEKVQKCGSLRLLKRLLASILMSLNISSRWCYLESRPTTFSPDINEIGSKIVPPAPTINDNSERGFIY